MSHKALVDEIRRFNRFYTGLVGLLDETLIQSPYTLMEARVLFELDRRPRTASGAAGFLARIFDLDLAPVASELAGELGIVPADVTRVVRKFAAMGLIETRKDLMTGPPVLSLTARGKAALAALETATNRDLARLVARLGGEEALELSDALQRVTRLLEKSAQTRSSAA